LTTTFIYVYFVDTQSILIAQFCAIALAFC